MNTMQQGIITLLRCAITGESLPLPEDFRLEEALPLIRSHGITTLVYEGAVRCGLDRKLPAMGTLFGSYCQMMLQSERQVAQIERLFQAFQDKGIDFLPVKGCKMKALYPRPELRLMGDADVLIRLEQYREKIVPLMQELGFVFEKENDRELVWESKGLHLELHKGLVDTFHKNCYAYFGSGWPLAEAESGTRYAMTPENEFVFYLVHFARHFQGGGIGCRHVVDLWVYLRSHPNLEEDRVCGVLSQLGLLEFYGNLRSLIRVWFAGGTPDPKTEAMTEYIFASGSWGGVASKTLSAALVDAKGASKTATGRFRYLLVRIFPNLATMQTRYPLLETLPWLLPLAWLYRIGYKLILKPTVWKYYGRRLRLINRESLENRAQFLKLVGLREKFE